MENNAIVAFPLNFKETPFLFYFKGIKSFMYHSLWLLSEEKCWGEFMHLIKSLFPALHAASCSCTSKWFSHKKLWEEASLCNTDSDTGKLHDLRKHSLVYQLKYAMTNVLQNFQWPIANWNTHCYKTKPIWKIHFPVSISVFCVGVFQLQVCLRATPCSESPGNKELQTENPQQPTKEALDHPDIWFWRKQVCISRQG